MKRSAGDLSINEHPTTFPLGSERTPHEKYPSSPVCSATEITSFPKMLSMGKITLKIIANLYEIY
jgi:hypothetical protein